MSSQYSIALISAGSALGGVIISQIFSIILSASDKRHQKNKLLRQKYEEMMFYFSMSFEWIQSVNNSTTRIELLSKAQCTESRKALNLCLLYFPSLVELSNKYILSQHHFYTSVVKSFDENKPIDAGGQAFEQNEKHSTIINDLFKSKNALENLLVAESKMYTNA